MASKLHCWALKLNPLDHSVAKTRREPREVIAFFAGALDTAQGRGTITRRSSCLWRLLWLGTVG